MIIDCLDKEWRIRADLKTILSDIARLEAEYGTEILYAAVRGTVSQISNLSQVKAHQVTTLLL